ncbi:MAG: hypothetical protein AB8F94_08070 [Saprospiraceae bacterium]
MKYFFLIFLILPNISFSQDDKKLQIKKKDDLYGLVNSKGLDIIEFKYLKIEEACDYFIITNSNKHKMLLNKKGDEVISKEMKNFKINCFRPNIILGTNLNGEIEIYNSAGVEISPIKFGSIPSYMNYSDESNKLVITKLDGQKCLLNFSDYSDEQPKLKIIEKPKGHNSAKIITYLPAEKGIFYRQVSLNNERFLSKPIYQDICFEQDCILKYQDKINIKATKSLFTKAVGILPDLTIHVFKNDGTISNQ